MITLLLILLLFSNALTVRRDKSILFGRIVMQNIIFVIFISLNNIYIKPLGNGIGIYSGLFHVTSFTQTFIIFIFIISFLILALNSFYPRTLNNDKLEYINFWPRKMSYFMSYMLVYDKNNISNKIGQQFRIIEYPLIIVFIMSGASFLISTGDLISIFLSIELQSYGLYILSTLYRDSESATASGLTYFLLGGLSSCFILLGSGLLYINSGTTSLENIYVITSLSEITTSSNWYQPYYIHLSLIILSVGFLFKITAAPFHFWSPDVYDGIPTIVTTYVAIIPKISIFAFLLELVYYTEHSILDFSWKNILLLSSLLSLFIGAVLGLTQSRLKRLYAYSTINHVGLILLALSISTVESTQSYIFYIWQYTIANLNAFIILVAMGFSLYKYLDTNTDSMDAEQGKKDNHFVDKNNSPIQLISQIRGYFHINPFIAISLSITLFSFAGIPPIIGFFGKQMVLSAALDSGYIFMAIIVILTSVISAAYYLNLIKEMFFFKANYENNDKLNNIKNYLAMRSRITWPFAQEYLDENKDFMDSRLVTKNSYITLSGSLASLISILTLWSILFMFTPQESFNFMNILTIIIFKV